VLAATRRLGAVALLGGGAEHLEQFWLEHYSAIPTIGSLFALNFVAAAVIAAGLLVLDAASLAVAGIGVAAGSLAGLLVSEQGGLFGFREAGFRPALALSVALELATVTLLGLHLARRRRARFPTRRSGPPADASATGAR
jgi:hypothetical protein